MNKNLWIILFVLMPWAGCIAGGFGTDHWPEDNFWSDSHYVTSIELFAHGGNAKGVFTEAFLIVGSRESIEMKIIDASRESVRFEGRVPAELIRSDHLTYYFEFRVSGETKTTRKYEAAIKPQPEQNVGDNPIYAPGEER